MMRERGREGGVGSGDHTFTSYMAWRLMVV